MSGGDGRARRIWVDADACPAPIAEILYRAARRLKVHLTMVANKALHPPESEYLHALRVQKGFDVVDDVIAENVAPGDLVVTADIPLAARIVDKGALGLNPRGEIYTPENIRGRLAVRDLLYELRESGVNTGGPAPLSARDRNTFANHLDQLLGRGFGPL